MSSDFVIITEYKFPNKYSISSLVTSLEIDPFLKDVQIKIFRRNIEQKDIRQLLDSYSKIIILFSLMSYQIKDFNEKLKLLSKFKKYIIAIAGGPHPTAKPKQLLDLGIDYVVIGEGENVIRLLLKNIIQNKPINTIKGLAYLKEGKLIKSEPEFKIDLNNYPICSLVHNLWGPIEISRGCPFSCSYCATSSIFGKNYRFRNVDNIISGLKKAIKHGYNKVWFLSSNSLAYKSDKIKIPNILELRNLLYSIRNLKGIEKLFFGTFPSEIRPDYVNDDAISAIREFISNDYFVMGGQHGSNSMLKKLNRAHNKEDIMLAIDILKSYKIKVHLDMIFGLPDETDREEEENIYFLKEIASKNVKIHSHYFMPLPNTRLEKAIPKPISPELQKIIGQLARKGFLYGQWMKQVEISKFLHSWT